MSDYWIPLGGGDEIGASAYFLSIDGVRILLDCGARLYGQEIFPDYRRLLEELPDLSEIDLIVISHGHYDHIGSFAQIAAKASRAQLVMTADTRSLVSLQLLEFGRISGKEESERVKNERYRQVQPVMERIQIRPVLKPFMVKGCRVTLLPAGHMIGAVMIYLESRSHRILYSGDFSVRTMFGQNGMKLPPDLRPDTLLLNAPNVYQDREEWERQLSEDAGRRCGSDHYFRLETRIRDALSQRHRVYLASRSVPKHMDLFYFLNASFSDVPVYLEEKSRCVADALADMGYLIYGENFHADTAVLPDSCIVVGQEEGRWDCVTVPFDGYSLHASPVEIAAFARHIRAARTYLTHVYPKDRKLSFEAVLPCKEQGMRIIQAVNGVKYYLKRECAMKHRQIYQEVMQKELAVARQLEQQEESRKPRQLKEWAAIYGGLLYPDCHPQKSFELLQRTKAAHTPLSYEQYKEAMHSANLDDEEKRRYVLSLVEQGVTLLKQALDGDRSAIRQFADFTEQLEPCDRRKQKRYFIGKSMVVFLVLIDPDLGQEEYWPIVRTFGARYCDRLLRNIRDRLLKEYGMTRRRRSARDVLQRTEEALTESSAAAAGFAFGNELEQLRFMNNNYKNSLELVQAMLDELNETIDETAADAKHAAIASFYSTMNSEDYGNLLDSMELVERRLAQLKEQKVKIPPQLLPLTIVFKQLLRFIRDCGITPIETTGRAFEAEAEELAEYTYIGEPYTAEGEKKTVEVERPGWKYGEVVISLPTVREMEGE